MKAVPLVLAAGALLCTVTSVRAQTGSSFNATLLARFDPSGRSYNDIWGYVSPTGKEYALLGTTSGTSIVDCSDPTNPQERAHIPGPGSIWRAIRTYREYIYVVTEGGGGVQIIDMTNPDQPRLAATWGQTLWTNAHTVALDQKTGMLYPCGTNRGVLFIDLSQDPLNPRQIGSYTAAYVHDLEPQDGYAHLAEINNSRYRILDVRSMPATTVLGSASVSSCHNAWPTRDNQIAVTTSETSGGGITVFDISDKRLIRQLAFWRTGSSGSSVHNVYIKDRVVHAAYYSEGYQALDISDPANPVRIAYYDTNSGSSGFNGAWGCYPYQPSGAVYVSDMQTGLHIFASPGSTALYGDATGASTGVVPSIHMFGAPWVRNTDFKLELENAPPGAGVTLLLGVAQSSLVFQGLTLNVDLSQPHLIVSTTTDASGKAVIPLPLAASLNPGTLYAQFLVADSGGPLGLAATRGAKIQLFRIND